MVSKIAFLFPGQGSQAIGMGKEGYGKSNSIKTLFEQANQQLGFNLSKIMFEGPEDELRQTHITQPALFLASVAGLELLKEKGITPHVVAGHSLGEYSALYAAGALSFEGALKLVYERGKAMNQAAQTNRGTMAAVLGLPPAKLDEICKQATEGGKTCNVANYNSESQLVISGSVEAMEKASQLAKEAGALKVIPLNVSGAFHSALMSPAVQLLKPFIESTPFNDSRVPVITNVDAQPTTSASDFKQKLLLQIDHSVLWLDTMKKLVSLGIEAAIEVGSGRVLSTLLKKVDRKLIVGATDDFEFIEKNLLSSNKI